MKLAIFCDKAHSLDISSLVLTRKAFEGININKMMFKCKTKHDFNQETQKEDFNIFNILMGLYYGYYNQYGYEHIKREIIQEVLKRKPRPGKTLSLIQEYYHDIVNYLQEKYQCPEERTKELLTKMFSLQENYDLYTSKEVKDISKFLLGVDLYLQENNLQYPFDLNVAETIAYFEEQNKEKIK